ncbi:unnamed protein product [Prorocentrum cordatum]|uniref:Uncharacterized protein n=1 Tax=Prorocentrum cordatum TaxID=2364126 RepID=A0ABN9T3P3_9DINO|nr:unnamed protein product [Polarella glacialis]
MDMIGFSGYLVLFLGELVDIYWAPIFFLFMQCLFGSMLMSSFLRQLVGLRRMLSLVSGAAVLRAAVVEQWWHCGLDPAPLALGSRGAQPPRGLCVLARLGPVLGFQRTTVAVREPHTAAPAGPRAELACGRLGCSAAGGRGASGSDGMVVDGGAKCRTGPGARIAARFARLRAAPLPALAGPALASSHRSKHLIAVSLLLMALSVLLEQWSEAADLPSRLRVGMGNPGPTGCMDRHGRRVLWRRLLEHPTSVQRAMNQLGIPIVGFPGARLPESFTLPASSGLGIYAVGGISYASVAVVWSLEFQAHFDFVMGVGSARRVWVQLRLAEGLLFLLYFYLPPDPRSGDDGAWGSEVDSIRREINSLRAQRSDAVFVAMGYANVQPVSLGGGRDISSGRDVRWVELLVETGLAARVVTCVTVEMLILFFMSLLLCLLHDAGGVQAGSLTLLGSVLEWDQVVVTLSGLSTVVVHEGMPEGGVLGPLGFNFLPDGLMRLLHSAGCGAATSTWVPVPWQQHVWLGCGTPRTHLVDMIVPLLECPSSLPSADMLAASPDLEASALRALDLHDRGRLPALLHCDDPVIVASSRGAAEEVLRFVAWWAKAFLGGASWRNSGVAALEMGLSLGGGAQAVLDLCRRRVRLHLLPENNFYRCAFLRGAAGGAQCWAVRSSDLLRVYGVPDWPQWAVPGAQLDGHLRGIDGRGGCVRLRDICYGWIVRVIYFLNTTPPVSWEEAKADVGLSGSCTFMGMDGYKLKSGDWNVKPEVIEQSYITTKLDARVVATDEGTCRDPGSGNYSKIDFWLASDSLAAAMGTPSRLGLVLALIKFAVYSGLNFYLCILSFRQTWEMMTRMGSWSILIVGFQRSQSSMSLSEAEAPDAMPEGARWAREGGSGVVWCESAEGLLQAVADGNASVEVGGAEAGLLVDAVVRVAGSLEHLSLTGCGLDGEALGRLATALAPTQIQGVGVSNNPGVGPEAWTAFWSALPASVSRWDAGDNGLEDACLEGLAAAAGRGALRELLVDGNSFCDVAPLLALVRNSQAYPWAFGIVSTMGLAGRAQGSMPLLQGSLLVSRQHPCVGSAYVVLCSSVVELDLGDNGLADAQVRQLAGALPGSAVETLVLGRNSGIADAGAVELVRVLPRTKVTILHLDSTQIGDATLAALAEVLADTQLEELHIDETKVTDQGVVDLCKVLPQSRLKFLDAGDNNLSFETAQAVQAAVGADVAVT